MVGATPPRVRFVAQRHVPAPSRRPTRSTSTATRGCWKRILFPSRPGPVLEAGATVQESAAESLGHEQRRQRPVDVPDDEITNVHAVADHAHRGEVKDHINVAKRAVVHRLGERAHVSADDRRERLTLQQPPPSRVRLIQRADLCASIDESRHEVRAEETSGTRN